MSWLLQGSMRRTDFSRRRETPTRKPLAFWKKQRRNRAILPHLLMLTRGSFGNIQSWYKMQKKRKPERRQFAEMCKTIGFIPACNWRVTRSFSISFDCKQQSAMSIGDKPSAAGAKLRSPARERWVCKRLKLEPRRWRHNVSRFHQEPCSRRFQHQRSPQNHFQRCPTATLVLHCRDLPEPEDGPRGGLRH